MFYTYITDDKYVKNVLTSYDDTERAILYKPNDNIITTSMAHLSMRLFDKYGFDEIWIGEFNRDPYGIFYNRETNEIECEMTNRELKLVHNLLKMWLSGEFY